MDWCSSGLSLSSETTNAWIDAIGRRPSRASHAGSTARRTSACSARRSRMAQSHTRSFWAASSRREQRRGRGLPRGGVGVLGPCRRPTADGTWPSRARSAACCAPRCARPPTTASSRCNRRGSAAAPRRRTRGTPRARPCRAGAGSARRGGAGRAACRPRSRSARTAWCSSRRSGRRGRRRARRRGGPRRACRSAWRACQMPHCMRPCARTCSSAARPSGSPSS